MYSGKSILMSILRRYQGDQMIQKKWPNILKSSHNSRQAKPNNAKIQNWLLNTFFGENVMN
jgi:hypothetical protein